MQLSKEEIRKFHRIWQSLILYVNRRANVALGVDEYRVLSHNDKCELREILWADTGIIDLYALENPDAMTLEELALAKSWKRRIEGLFLLTQPSRKDAFHFMPLFNKDPAIYQVLALQTPFSKLGLTLPTCVSAALIPFGDKITFDGALASPDVPQAMVRMLLMPSYRVAIKRGRVITSLAPEALSAAV